jgi:manganese-dependent ADP-ribose/CDP-alcohol diphosphatase
MLNVYRFLLLLGLLFPGNRAFSQTDSIPLFTFGVMTDVQYCDCENAGTRYYRSSLRKLNEAVQTFNQKNVAFVTHLGDFIDHDFESYDTLNAIVKQLNSPLYQVLGNHDFSVKQEEIKKVPAILQLKNRYYSFARNRWRFIVLDGNDLSVYGNIKTGKIFDEASQRLENLKAQKVPNAQSWNGGLGEKQVRWLKKELASAAKKCSYSVTCRLCRKIIATLCGTTRKFGHCWKAIRMCWLTLTVMCTRKVITPTKARITSPLKAWSKKKKTVMPLLRFTATT